MKLAKKTLSVALAAVMAASSLAGATSVFAADAVQNSAVKYTAITGSTTVKPNVTIDATKAAKTADITAGKITADTNISNQIDETTLNNYYSFTPARTGVYVMTVESSPIYYGYSRSEYAKYADKKGLTDAEKAEKAHVYSAKEGELYTDTTWTTKVTTVQDSVVIDKVTKDADKVDSTPENALISSATTVKSTDKTETKAVLSYKYVNYNDSMKGIVEDKVVKTSEAGKKITLGTLTAGKTYYFKATLANLTTTKVEKDSKDVEYTKVAKSDSYALASAKLTIAQKTGMVYDTTYTDARDKQKVEVPSTYTAAAGETVSYDSKTNKYYVEKTVQEGTSTATYYGYDTAATVADTANGAKVEAFDNEFAGLATLTLGKNVKYVYNVDKAKAPQLKTVVINNPEFDDFGKFDQDKDKITLSVPANSKAWYTAISQGFKVNVVCTNHKYTTIKAATIFAAGQKKCTECGAVATIAKVKFAPTAKASKKNIVVKGNAGKVAKLAVWVYDSKGNLVKKQVKKNVTKNTVKVSKAGKYTVKVKAYGTNGAKTSSVKKTVKVK